MKMKHVLAFVALLALTMLSTSNAQTVRWIGETGDWTDDSKWDTGFYPWAQFDGVAEISNGGTVNVTGAVGQNSPSITLGDGLGNSGTLNLINASSNLRAETINTSTGDVVVGANSGVGTLNVTDGTLTIDGQLSTSTNADAATQIKLAGSASISMNSAFLDRGLRVEGSNVSFSATGNVTLGLAGTHTWQIPASGTSTMSVGGQLDLGGTLRLEFPTSPTVGTTWNLADSATVVNAFSNIDDSTVTGLGNGETFAVQTVSGGSNGTLTQLVLEQHPVLTVNRQTGRVKIKNLGTANSIDFDGYAITSDLETGPFNTANWESLQSNSVGDWVEANPGPNALSELNPIGSSFVAGSGEFDLGTPFELPTPSEFGEVTEDVRFRYAKPTGGGWIEGEVRYEGVPNNTFVLNVDPTTGESHLWNPTVFTEAIDAYVITSATNSLDVMGWESLDFQDEADGTWAEANPSAGQLSELQAVGTTTLTPGTSFNLGDLFDINGERDLVFEFALADEDFFRRGIVSYGAFAPLPSGDFNNDGFWDFQDIDALTAAIATQSDDLSFDMNGDGQITIADLEDEALGWLTVGGAQNPDDTGGNPFLAGDANLDGFVDGQDFIEWNGSKFTANTNWTDGNFNADLFVDGQDFIDWNTNKFTSSSGQFAAVPEPHAATFWCLVIAGLVPAMRRRR